ncbi:MAG: response regulator transcription factor [Chloroflexi bacterium]|nr:response regulator transcription factor [Chloroflexota bacterium]
MISVLLVDDQELFREIARSMFEATGDFKVVGEAADGVEAVSLYSACKPDFVLMDVQMARMNGIEAAKRILSSDPRANVVLISMRADAEYARAADQLGCKGFIAKRDLDVDVIRRLLAPSSVPVR